MKKKQEKLENQSQAELKIKGRELLKEIYLLKNKREEEGKLEKPHLLRTLRRERARALTFLRQKSESFTKG